MATTALATSAKQEFAQGTHCFLATQSGVSASITNTSTAVTGIASTALLAVGMAVTGTGIAANTVIAAIPSATTITLSIAATATNASASLTFTGDVFKFLLIKVSPTGTYDATLTNVGTPGSGSPSTSNVGTDEVTGTGYTSGGFTMTNSNPTTSGTTAYWTFTTNPNWTSASFSAVAGVLYNSSVRQGGVVNRVIGVYDFGGTQTVSSGTFTVTLPANDSTHAICRIA